MDIYQIWCDLEDSSADLEFAAGLRAFLGTLERDGKINGFRLTRRKLGFGPPGLGEWSIAIEVDGLARLDAAFGQVATRSGPIEDLHRRIYSVARNVQFGLYRDFPDDVRGT